MIIADRRRALPRLLALAAVLAGLAAWVAHLQSGLVLSHYDARAHLVVARRVIDNLTPGWQQIGAVWLPLPHLLNLLPTQNDFLYRTGVAASALSIASFGFCAWATARLVLAVTGSAAGAATSVAVLALNPNLLYLQATPMTEPLLLALSAAVVLWLFEWVNENGDNVPRRLGAAMAALAWTRYEGWAVLGAALAASVYAQWRRGAPPGVVARRALRLAVWPATAVALFLINSRITVGAWFVSGGFFVPDPEYQGRAIRTLVSLWWGTHELGGYLLTTVALATAVVLSVQAVARPERAGRLIPVALLAAGALPFVAFFDGHPYRIRYMVPLVAACATLAGISVGMLRRTTAMSAVLIVASVLMESPPWRRNAPLLLEAQWDRPNSLARRAVTACLSRDYSGDKVLASMGSLAHYMHELSAEGFDIADFIHEGNGVIWEMALDTGPAPHAGWMLVEEQAEGGDVLAERVRHSPAFARGMIRVCEGGGVALYQRTRPRARGGRGDEFIAGDAEGQRIHMLGDLRTVASSAMCSSPRPRLSPRASAGFSTESQPERELIRPAAQVDPRTEELLRQVRLRCLITDFPARREAIAGEADAAECHRPRLAAAGHVGLAEDRVVGEVDELARLAVPPVEQADAHAKVRLHRVVLAERKHAHGGGERDEAEAKILIDLAAVVIDEVFVDRRDRAAVEADARANLEVLGDWNQPIGAYRRTGEVAHLEEQQVPVLDEDVVIAASVEAAGHEAAEREVERLLCGGRLRPPGDAGAQCQ